MVGNYLHYKLYLMLKASKPDLYAVIKNIFISFKIESQGKVDDAEIFELDLKTNIGTDIYTDVANAILAVTKLDQQCKVGIYADFANTVLTASKKDVVVYITGHGYTVPDLAYSGMQLASHDSMRVTAKVCKRAFYPVSEIIASFGMLSSAKIAYILRIEDLWIDSAFNFTLSTVFGTPMKSASKINSYFTFDTSPVIDSGADLQLSLPGVVGIKFNIDAADVFNIKYINDIKFGLSTKASLIRDAILADYDNSQLKNMDPFTLQQLYDKEI